MYNAAIQCDIPGRSRQLTTPIMMRNVVISCVSVMSDLNMEPLAKLSRLSRYDGRLAKELSVLLTALVPTVAMSSVVMLSLVMLSVVFERCEWCI